MSQNRATDDTMDAIHLAVALILKERLEKTGEDGKREATSEDIKNAMKFLKDNGVDAPSKSERLSNLAQELAEIDLDEAAQVRLN